MSGFSLDVLERTARTIVQVVAAAVLALWIDAGSFSDIDWNVIWQTALYAAGLSILMGLAGKGFGSPDNASYRREE
jgi:hypothetical protein